MIGAAALRAVAVRQTAMDAQGRVHGPDRLAGLGRIDRKGAGVSSDFGGGVS